MLWARRNAVGLLGLTLALAALAVGAEAYRAGVRRDEQTSAIPRRLEQGEPDLAVQHRKSAAVLNDYAVVLRPVKFYAAVTAAVVGVWHLRRRQPTVWLTVVVIVLALGAILLAQASHGEPGAAAAAGASQLSVTRSLLERPVQVSAVVRRMEETGRST